MYKYYLYCVLALMLFLAPMPIIEISIDSTDRLVSIDPPVAHALFGFDSIGDMFDGGGAGGSGDTHCACSHEDYVSNGGTGGQAHDDNSSNTSGAPELVTIAGQTVEVVSFQDISSSDLNLQGTGSYTVDGTTYVTYGDTAGDPDFAVEVYSGGDDDNDDPDPDPPPPDVMAVYFTSTSDCSIAIGASACTTASVSWTSSNLGGNTLRLDRAVNNAVDVANTADDFAVGLNYGSNDFRLRIMPTDVVADTVTLQAECTTSVPSRWTGTVCEQIPPASVVLEMDADGDTEGWITTSPYVMTLGEEVTFRWTSTEATSCSATVSEGDGGDFSTGGATENTSGVSVREPSIGQATNYSVRCAGPGGDSPWSTIRIENPAPAAEILSDPFIVEAGDLVNLGYDITGRQPGDCIVVGPGVSETLNGSVTGQITNVAIAGESTFTLSCSANGINTASTDSVTVRITGTATEN